MKKVILSILLICLMFGLRGQIVTGSLIYSKKKDIQDNENVILSYGNFKKQLNVNLIDGKAIEDLLILSGIKKDDILITRGYGNSTLNEVETFFAYKGRQSTRMVNIGVQTYYNTYFSTAYNDGILIPWFTKIGDKMDSIAIALAKLAAVNSFMCRNIAAPGLALVVLSNGITGTLADMRNVPNSYRLVPYFKELNWNLIWWMEADGTVKGEFKPVGGWAKNSNHLESRRKLDRGALEYHPKNESDIIEIEEPDITGALILDSNDRPKEDKIGKLKSEVDVKLLKISKENYISNFQTEQAIRFLTLRIQDLEAMEGECCCESIHHVYVLAFDYFGTFYENDPAELNINDRFPFQNICGGSTGVLIMNDATIYFRWMGEPDQWVIIAATHGGLNQ